MKKNNEGMLHQKLYQIKMAISCWVEMNISFSSKFNLSPDDERKQGEACWWRLGAGELSWWIWTKAGRGHRRIGYRRKLLWCVIPLSVSESRDWKGEEHNGCFTCAYTLPFIRLYKHELQKKKKKKQGPIFCFSQSRASVSYLPRTHYIKPYSI